MKIDGNRCFSCIPNCKTCNSNSTCEACDQDFFLRSPSLCEKIIYLEPKLYSTDLPNIFRFSLGSPSKDLVARLEKQAQKLFIFSTTPNEVGIGLSFLSEVISDSDVLFAFKVQRDIPSGSKIKLNIVREAWMNEIPTNKINYFYLEIIVEKTINYCQGLAFYHSGKQNFNY